VPEFTVFAVFVGTHVDLELNQLWKKFFQLWDDANTDEEANCQGQRCHIAKRYWGLKEN
jgi:hypothetical protein